jgi:threonine 3-dehydrogenase
MRALVTGGTGFIGLAVGRALAADGAEVTLADVRPREELVDFPAKVRAADLGSWAEILHVTADTRPEVIVHAGALLSATGEAIPLRAFEANGAGTLHVLEAAVLLGVGQVLLMSSIASYGPGVPDVVDEDTPQRPITMYGITKVLGELLGEYYARRFGLDVRAARFPSVIGPGRGRGGASAYSTLMIEEPAAGRPYLVPVPEDVSMPLLYVDDAVRSLLELRAVPAASLPRRTYGIGGFSPTAGEIAATVSARVPGAQVSFAPEAETTAIVRSWPRVLSGDAAAADWGWAPRFLLEETVDDFIAKVQARPVAV